MVKIRLFIYSVLVALMMHFYKPFLLTDNGVNDEIKPYWDKEITTIQANCKKPVKLPLTVYVDFGDSEGAIAYCQRFTNGFKIIIDKNYWDLILDRPGKRQLLLHEMMHCIFKVGHIEDDATHFMAPVFYPLKENVILIQLADLLAKNERCN